MKPRRFKRGDPFSARHMNDIIGEATRSRSDRATGPGFVNDGLGNQVFNEEFSRLKLCVAIEDFKVPDVPTDIYNTVDKAPSGKCLTVRLNDSAEYLEGKRSEPFRVYDPISYLNRKPNRQLGEAFWAVFNKDTKRWEVIATAGGTGGGAERIWFYIVDVYCPDAENDPCLVMSVEVEWTDYTGGCDVEPPGVDPYTGLITVFDRGVLEYFTADQLLNGGHYGPNMESRQGLQGSATYFYSREPNECSYECGGRWLIDSILGNPECNDLGVGDVGVST